jgi:hypothetical protein
MAKQSEGFGKCKTYLFLRLATALTFKSSAATYSSGTKKGFA